MLIFWLFPDSAPRVSSDPTETEHLLIASLAVVGRSKLPHATPTTLGKRRAERRRQGDNAEEEQGRGQRKKDHCTAGVQTVLWILFKEKKASSDNTV